MNIATILQAGAAGVMFGIGGALGLTFADIDLAPPLPIRHRSAWTHGMWIAIPLLLLRGNVPVYWFAIGFLPAHAWHLLHDMFPEHWQGGARISLYPLGWWRLGGALSVLWLLLNAAGSMLAWLWLSISIYERWPELW